MVATSPVDHVEFLARSPHRVEVLERLREGPWTRPDLHAETGISQPTLGRVLGSLQDRNWVERDGRAYVLTAFGAIVAEEFAGLLSTMATVDRLGDVVPLLPADLLDFDLRRLADARITTPETGDPLRHVRRVEELVYGADHLRLLSNTTPPGTDADMREEFRAFMADDREIESVITADSLDAAIAEAENIQRFHEALSLDRFTAYRYDGTIPAMLGVVDGTVMLVATDGSGIPAAVIESDDEAVREWAESTIDGYIAESTELTVEDLPG